MIGKEGVGRAALWIWAAAMALPLGAQDGAAAKGIDAYGDPLPAGARARIGTARMRHGLELSCLEYSPDGLSFVTSAMDFDQGPAVLLWDSGTGKKLRNFVASPHPNGTSSLIYPIAISRDGKVLAGVSLGIHLWDVASGQEIRHWDADLGRQIRCLAFSPDGRQLAAGDGANGIRLFDVATGTEARAFPTPTAPQPYGMSMAFSPDGKQLATGGEDRKVHLWDVEGGQEKRALLGHSDRILSLAWSPDGARIATGSADRTVRLWDPARGEEVLKLEGHPKDVTSVAFSPDSRIVLSADYRSSIRSWDAVSGTPVRALEFDKLSNRVAFSPDRKKALVAVHAVIRLLDLATGKDLLPTSGHTREIQGLIYSPDGRRLYSQGGDDTVRSWHVGPNEELSRIDDHVSAGGSIALSSDGRRLGVGSWDDLFMRDLIQNKELWRNKTRAKGSITLAFAPDGKTLAWTVGLAMNKPDYAIHLTNAETGEELRALRGHQGAVSVLAFAADGRTIASASAGFQGDNSIRLWDASTGGELRKFEARQKDPQQFFVRGYTVFSPDLSVVGTSDDRSLALRDAVSGKEFARLECANGLCISAAVFSPDGRYLASAESRVEGGFPIRVPNPPPVERIRLWEVATSSPLGTFEPAQRRITTLAFSPDGRMLASGGRDTTILFWDLESSIGERQPPGDLARLWDDLADPDASKAWKAVVQISSGRDAAVSMLAEHLKPARADIARVRQWIADLSSPSPAVQLKASKMLGQSLDLAGTRAEIQKALDAQPSEELRGRLEALLFAAPLQAGSRSPDELRRGRALHVLEVLGTPKAKEALRAIADGDPSGLSRDARAGLARIESRCGEGK